MLAHIDRAAAIVSFETDFLARIETAHIATRVDGGASSMAR
jgi:hypothetical protein